MYRGLLRISGMLMLAGLVLSTPIWAEDNKQVYAGTLGKAAIVVEIDTRYSEGRYFYKNTEKTWRWTSAKKTMRW